MNPSARRLLFVCTGNTCRSPLARFLAERLAREAGLAFSASSAGLAASVGAPMTAGASRALATRGIKGVRHASHPLTASDVAAADKIYALAREHRDALIQRFPAAAAKTAVLREAAGLPDPDVSDPAGRSDADYEDCAARIEEALRILIAQGGRHAQNPR